MGSIDRRGRRFFWVACLCLQLTACGAMAETSRSISPHTLVSQIESGTAPLILDVRTAKEYGSGHIPGAINIHFRELEARLDEIPRTGPIVVYCERGIRANIAERTLRDAGIAPLLHLEGDISLWRQRDLPLERDGGSPASISSLSENPTTGGDIPDSAQVLAQRWVVSGVEAKQLIDRGATLLDTRKLALGRLQGAVYVDWRQFSPDGAAARGNLLDNNEVLTQRLQQLGISKQRPVVVFANPPGGWGEDGRIVWMLRTLGHGQAVMVDGGVEALVEAGVPRQTGKALTPEMGDFVVDRRDTWEIQREQLQDALGQDNIAVIDTREAREFAGKTPYGEQRGGHIPGAVHLYFKEFLDADGKLLASETIHLRLAEAGITRNTQIVVYCTGGIRSGWLAAVLITLGYDVKNYAGSMWEWSAGPADRYPLKML